MRRLLHDEEEKLFNEASKHNSTALSSKDDNALAMSSWRFIRNQKKKKSINLKIKDNIVIVWNLTCHAIFDATARTMPNPVGYESYWYQNWGFDLCTELHQDSFLSASWGAFEQEKLQRSPLKSKSPRSGLSYSSSLSVATTRPPCISLSATYARQRERYFTRFEATAGAV